MIESAEEFVRLRNSEIHEEYSRAAHDEASIEVWNAVLENYPDMAFWVVQNKTVPYELLEALSCHEEERLRLMVAMKNKIKEPLLLKLASDTSDSVRMSVARHKQATLTVLKQLETDSWDEIVSVVSDRIENGNHK